MNGWKVWVRTHGGKTFATNAVIFKTKEEAEAWGQDLFMRWTAVAEWEVREERKLEPVGSKEEDRHAC